MWDFLERIIKTKIISKANLNHKTKQNQCAFLLNKNQERFYISWFFNCLGRFYSFRTGARKAALVCGMVILVWIAVQVIIIGYVSWMQPATTVAAAIILLLTWQLPKYGR